MLDGLNLANDLNLFLAACFLIRRLTILRRWCLLLLLLLNIRAVNRLSSSRDLLLASYHYLILRLRQEKCVRVSFHVLGCVPTELFIYHCLSSDTLRKLFSSHHQLGDELRIGYEALHALMNLGLLRLGVLLVL